MTRRCFIFVLLAVLATASSAFADTLVCRDGRILRGTVEKNGAYYTIVLKMGGTKLTLHETDVQKWERDAPSKPAAPPAPPAKPAAPVEAPAEPTPPPVVEAPPTPPAEEPPVETTLTVDVLLDRGRAALKDDEFGKAREAYEQAHQIDPDNPRAVRGLAAAYVQLRQWDHATPLLQQAARTGTDRPLAINLAAAEMGTGNPQAAATLAAQYLSKQRDAVDEQMLNVLTVALAQMPSAQNDPEMQPTLKTYHDSVAKLEAARKGEKRWGLSWLTAAEVDRKRAAYNEALLRIEPNRRAIATATQQRDTAAAEIENRNAERRGSDDLEKIIAQAEQTIATNTAAIDDLLASVDQPEIPDQAEPAAMSDTPGDATVKIAIAETPAVKPRPRTDGNAPAIGGDEEPDKRERRGRRGSRFAAAFPISNDLVVTAAEPLIGAKSAELQTRDGSVLKANIVRIDDQVGLAMLKVEGKRLGYLTLGQVFDGGKISVTSYPNNNIIEPKPESVEGNSPSPASATPQKPWRIVLSDHPRLPGGPIMAGGQVVGVELATEDDDADAVPAVTLAALKKFVGGAQPGPSSKEEDPVLVVMQLIASK